MTNYSSDLKQWGDTGSVYPDGYSYAQGEPPVDEWDDHFNYNVERDINHLITLTNDRLDSGAGSTYPLSPTPGHVQWRTDTRRAAVYDDTAAAFREFAYKSEFDGHTAATNNPHSVTTAQIGAVNQTTYDSHAGDAAAHHTRYADSEAQAAIDGTARDLSGLTVGTRETNNSYSTLTDAQNASLPAGSIVWVEGESRHYFEDGQ